MYGELKFPAKASMLNDAFIKIANFKWFDTWKKIDLKFFFYLPEDEAFNSNFKDCGYESTYLLPNSSFTIWILYANCALVLVWLLFKIIARCTNKFAWFIKRLSAYLFWNGPIRLFMEVFFEITFTSSLNLYVIDWDTPF
jgi:hypothetical protein